MKKESQRGVAAVIGLFVIGALAIGAIVLGQQIFNVNGDVRSQAATNTLPQTVTYKIDGSNFVANEDGSTFETPSAKAWIGTGRSTSASYLGLLFRGANVPKSAVIEKATLQVTAADTQWIPLSVSILAQTDANATEFSQSAKPSARILTANSAQTSDNVKWEKDQNYSFDVTSVVRELVATSDRNSIGLIAKGSGQAFGRKFVYATGDKAPKLIVTFKAPGSIALPTTSPVASNKPRDPSQPNPSGTASARPTATAVATAQPTMPGHTGSADTSHAYGVWTPTSRDTCSKEIHDSYHVVVAGKKYPTWHPPVDPRTGCTFGHEHGRDPNGSDLLGFIRENYGTAGNALPFGLANEKLDEWNLAQNITNGMRHEDHVGHKIEWENNVELTRNVCDNTPASPGCFDRISIGVQCDFLMKIHQGTHSKDAFTNNMHELEYFVQCTDGTKIAATKMVLFGKPGEFVENAKTNTIKVGTATPPNSTAGNGVRFIPTIGNINEFILVPNGQWSLFSNGLYEDWLSSNYFTTPENRQIAYFDPHFAVFSPSRYFDSSKPDNVGRSIDVCYMSEKLGLERARGGECDALTNYGKNMTPIAYDDPRSPFNGVKREMYFNQTLITNAGGPTTWYTDPFGRGARTTPFPGSIKQFVASINNDKGFALESRAIGGTRYYGGNGVHAPN